MSTVLDGSPGDAEGAAPQATTFDPLSWSDYVEVVERTLRAWGEAAAAKLPSAVLAFALLVAFLLAARLAARALRRVLERTRASGAITALASSLVQVLVVGAGLFFSLQVLGLEKTVFSLLAGAGVVGLALGFAFQDVASNLIAGVAMGLRKPLRIGDLIETNGHFGRVRKLNLRNTLVETFSGQVAIVPNKEVFEQPLVNYSMTGRRRVEIEVGVAYDSDLDEVVEVATGAIEALDFRSTSRPVEVLAKSFGGSSIDFEVRFWIDGSGEVDFPHARHRGVLAVKRAFDEHGIEIPFPIRTLELGSSARVERLTERLRSGTQDERDDPAAA